MPRFSLSTPSDDISNAISEWLRDYIDVPHPELGRDGPVCPFVAPSLRAGSLAVLTHEWDGELKLATMTGVISATVDKFQRMTWRSANSNLYALVVVITGLPEQGWWLIDDAHRAAKDNIVAQGLMLGQFHPLCDEPAARNPLFRVNRSPYPLFAIRNMALHDILFLHENPRWFSHYQDRFGHRFSGSARMDSHFTALFQSAAQRQLQARLADTNLLIQER